MTCGLCESPKRARFAVLFDRGWRYFPVCQDHVTRALLLAAARAETQAPIKVGPLSFVLRTETRGGAIRQLAQIAAVAR